MSKFAKQVDLSASHSGTATQGGRLLLSVEHASATIKTIFSNLNKGLSDEIIENNENATVRVDLKKLAQVLNFNQQLVDQASLFFNDNLALILHVTMIKGNMTFYVPVIQNVNQFDEV
jgi:hypothetical protein